ncbi:MAG TPA: phage tail tape measure protein [Beijerinckiaceae bacterium]|jgi:phage-related minor tail protein
MNDFDAQDLESLAAGLDRIDVSADRVAGTLTRAFAQAATSGRALDDTLRGVALSLSKMALTAGLKPLQDGLSSILSSAGASLAGAGATPVAAFAEGGVVSRPTFFGAGGGLGLMGERGAEAIMPLARGPDGRLGVAASGKGGATTINVSITTPDAESFRRSQAQVTGALARAVARGRRGV